MLIDYLSPIPVLSMPQGRKWSLKGFVAMMVAEGELDDVEVIDQQVLIVCQSREAPKMLRRYPGSPFLIVHDGDSAPEWCREFANRTMVLRKDRAYSYILFLIQEFFLNLLFWSKRMNDIVSGTGSFQELVDASQEILENFVALADTSNVILARSREMNPADSRTRQIVEAGFISPQALGGQDSRNIESRGRIQFLGRRDRTGVGCDACLIPIRHMGSWFGSMYMSCDQIPLTEGLYDHTMLFLGWVGRLCEKVWKVELDSNNPINMLFANIISGNAMDGAVVQEKMEQLDLPTDVRFKLIMMKTDPAMDSKSLVSMMEAAGHLNDGRSMPFRYSGDILALVYASDKTEGSLSVEVVNREVVEAVCEPYGVFAGTSRVFVRIEDLDLAYRQTCIACEYRETMDMEASMMPDASQRSVYAFEDVMVYYLIDQDIEKRRLREFTFSISFLDKIIERDADNGSNDFKLLWAYLNSDCNISLTAKRLFMHRNTVVYHIDKLKEIFQLDFSDKSTRDRALMDYRIKFLVSTKHRYIDTRMDRFLSS